MNLSIRPIDSVNHPNFVGEVSGLDMRRPTDPEDLAAFVAAMDRFAVLIMRDQKITDDEQVAFSRQFGPLEQATGDSSQGRQRRLSMEVNDISNLNEHNERLADNDHRRYINLNNRSWHTDSSYKRTPAKYSLLSARVIPSSEGNTEFADMRAAYDELPDKIKAEVKDLVCEHSQFNSRSLLGLTAADFTPEQMGHFTPVPQRLVRRHPTTGRLSLYLASHAGSIVGWKTPEARVLLRELTEHATQRKFVYSFAWRENDAVMWDNRVTMHRSTRYDSTQVRDMHRTTVGDVAPTVEQAV